MCPFCVQAKSLLNKRGIEFEEVEVDRSPESRSALAEKTGMMTFPQILINGEVLGGFDDLSASDKSGKLAELLA